MNFSGIHFPKMEDFRALCFPPENPHPSEEAKDIANTVVRHNLTVVRHPENQGGIVVLEDGSVEIRSGHPSNANEFGSAIVLHPNGTVSIIAPNGLVHSGTGTFLPDSPSSALKFSHGTVAFNPRYEEFSKPLCLRFPLPIPLSELFLLGILPGSPVPVPVPLAAIVEEVPLYTEPE